MVKNRTIVYLATVVLLVFVFALCLVQREQSDIPFSVQVITEERTEKISLWESESGEYYVFLPSYAQPNQVQIHLHTGNPVSLNGVMLEDGLSCDAFAPDVPYVLTYTAWGMTKQKTVTFLQSANVATMYIDTQSGSMEYIHEKKGNEDTGTMRLYTPEGGVNHAGDVAALRGRGNSTWWDFEKKSYSLNLAAEADLLGMGTAQRWILLANAGDASHLRNKIVYDFAQDVGLAYSPDSQWVDLYLNGEYAGLYLLCERNEVHPQRVDVAPNGSFLVSLEQENRLISQNYPYVVTQDGQALRIHHPLDASVDVQTMITETMQSVENAIQACDDIDYKTGEKLHDLIDVDSWVKKYLIEEIFGNIDAGNISQYFYYDVKIEESKLAAGPVWDYDHALGNRDEWQLVAENTLFANREIIENGDSTPWYYYLAQKEMFNKELKIQYQEFFLPLLENLIEIHIDVYVEEINGTVKLNQIRWNNESIALEEEAEYIQGFLEERISFLSKVWLEDQPYYLIKALNGTAGYYGYFAVFSGEFFENLPAFEDSETSFFLGWYYTDTDEPFDPTRPITEDIAIYAKWEPKETNKLSQVIKLIPLGTIAILGIALLLVDIRRMKRSR